MKKITPFVYSLDIGKLIASAAVSYDNPLSRPLFMDQSPLLARKDGRVWIKFEENRAYEYCRGFIEDRWEWFSQGVLNQVEVQMCMPYQGGDRMTIMIASTFFAILSTLHAEGKTPPCIMLSPGWWRKAAGAEAVRVGHQSQYEANKAKSIEVFRFLYGEKLFEEIKTTLVYGKDFHDVPEAILMGYAAANSPEYIQSRLELTSTHHGYLGQKPGTPVKAEERKVAITPFGTYKPPTITAMELLKTYSLYNSQVNQAKEVRQYKSLEKKINKGMLGGVGVVKKEKKKRKLNE